MKIAFNYNYIQNYKGVATLHSTIAIILYLFFWQGILKYITIGTMFLFALTVFITLICYKAINSNKSLKKVAANFTDFRSFNYAYLFTKLFEILMQQFIVMSLLYILHNAFIPFLISFVALHLINFFIINIEGSIFFLLFSIPASVVFYLVYNFAQSPIGIAYLIHVSFYLVVGAIAVLNNGKRIIRII